VLIGRCSKYTTIDGEAKDLDAETRTKIEEIKNIWSSQGKRVILLARKIVSKEHIHSNPSSSHFEGEVSHQARSDLTFVGIVSIVDPPREEIPYVVSTLRGAGIRIFMVSSKSSFPDIILIRLGHRRLQSHRASNCC
jgi:sodium/potassium-transporting ATPase subunit alpha